MYKNQQLLISHIAKEVKNLIDQKRDMQVTYTLQKLSRTDEQEAHDGLKPIAEDLAIWFVRFVKVSPDYAIVELIGLSSYIGKLYPELIDAVNQYKVPLVKNLLKQVKIYAEDTRPLLRKLKNLINMGIDWPELVIIYDNLKKDANR